MPCALSAKVTLPCYLSLCAFVLAKVEDGVVSLVWRHRIGVKPFQAPNVVVEAVQSLLPRILLQTVRLGWGGGGALVSQWGPFPIQTLHQNKAMIRFFQIPKKRRSDVKEKWKGVA